MPTFESEKDNVGAGWQPLILEVHERLTEIFGTYEVHQIKEKFGGLRYYYGAPRGATEMQVLEANTFLHFIEEVSELTCEECGKPGKNRATRNWLQTLCDEHRAQDEARYSELEERLGMPQEGE